MPALFSPRAATLFRGVLLGGVVVAILLPLVLMGYVRGPYVTGVGRAPEQPVPFDHRHHVVDDGIDCRYCHTTADRSPRAGIPSTEVCMGCHSQIWAESPLLEPVRESYFEGRPIRWARVHRLPDFVYFDHRIHVSRGVGCESCHGRVDQMARVRQVEPLTMGWCLECHRNPEPHLRPPEAVVEMGYRPDSAQEVTGAHLAREMDIRPSTDCTACHR